MKICPLSMIGGNPTECELSCQCCPPQAMEDLAKDFDGLTYLLNTKPGEALDVCGGLSDVADAIMHHAENVWEVGEAIRGRAKRFDMSSIVEPSEN